MSLTTSAPVEIKTTNLFDQIANYDHEQVVFCYDKNSGLKSIIAIHNTTLGPALGGTRFWNYKSESDAIFDVLRLSRGMTFKAAAAGLNLGGGKAVIIGDSHKDKSEAIFRRYGKFVNSLNGKYITAEDVGTSTQDMEYASLETQHVTGVPEYMGGSGDPSPFTAYGTFLGIKASVFEAYGSVNLSGKKVLVQGVGHVGETLVQHLTEAGAKVFITDIFESRVNEVAKKYKATPVDADSFYDMEMDIYSPCALGATLTTSNIERLKCRVIAGAANNQLEDEKLHGQMLIEKGIVYAPDFVINAGGLINVASELEGYNRDKVNNDVEKIYDRVLSIFKIAKSQNITNQQAAIFMAEKRIRDIGHINSRL
jgi:leucine dehydrogenase